MPRDWEQASQGIIFIRIILLVLFQKNPKYNGLYNGGTNWDNMSFNLAGGGEADCNIDPDFHFVDNVDKPVSFEMYTLKHKAVSVKNYTMITSRTLADDDVTVGRDSRITCTISHNSTRQKRALKLVMSLQPCGART